MKLLSACVVIAVLCFADVVAQHDDRYMAMFTDYVLGDSVRILDEYGTSRMADGHVAVFVDVNSCFTCSAALRVIQNVLKEKKLEVEIVAFLGGKSQEYCDVQKKRNGWNFRVVADPIYAYQSLYKVKVTPFYYVLDRTGRILLMDKCGGVHVESGDIAKALMHARGQYRSESSASGLHEIYRRSVVDSAGKSLVVSSRTFILWSPQRIVLFDAGMKLIHVADTSGKVQRTIDLRRYGALVMSPLEPSWAYGDSVLLGADVSLNPVGRRVFYLLNVNTGEVRNLNFDDTSVRSVYHVMTKPAFDAATSRVFVGIRPRNNTRLADDSPMMIAIDSNGRELKRFGRPDSCFVHYRMSDALLTLVKSHSSGKIYECQSPSRRFNIYDVDGNLLRTIIPDFGRQRKDFAEEMPVDANSGSMEYWVGMNSRCSHSMHILPSTDGSQIALVYMNSEYPPGVADPLSSQVRLPKYLHRMTSEGVRIGNGDIPLPIDSKPFRVENDTIGLIQLENDRAVIVYYRIDPMFGAK